MKKVYKIFGDLYKLIIFLFFVILICFILIEFNNRKKEFIYKGNTYNIKQNFDFTTDKKNYSFGDTIKLKIVFNNFTIGKTINLKVIGLKAKNGFFKINKSRQVEIKNIPYQIIYNIKVPYCSKCSGIVKGKYPLKVFIIKDGKIIGSKSKNIILK